LSALQKGTKRLGPDPYKKYVSPKKNTSDKDIGLGL
jgi:hypothetical protein